MQCIDLGRSPKGERCTGFTKNIQPSQAHLVLSAGSPNSIPATAPGILSSLASAAKEGKSGRGTNPEAEVEFTPPEQSSKVAPE